MSSNTELLRAAARLCDAEVILFEGLRDIAPFDPDLADDEAPQPVKNFRALIQNADAVLISSPEYARGVSGVLKNALDWTVPTRRPVREAGRGVQHPKSRPSPSNHSKRCCGPPASNSSMPHRSPCP